MPKSVPPIDLTSDSLAGNGGREALEFELLELEAKLKRIAYREVGQRYKIKWIAVISGVFVIAGMAAMMGHLVHRVFWGPFLLASPAFSVAMIVAPVLSITATTFALFVGAFRRFEDKDLESVTGGIAGGVNMIRGA